MTEWRQTEFLVLRKTVYSETSLVLAGLSADHGQLHFMARGARRWGRRDFPVADLFRILSVTYRPGRGDLLSWHQAEVVEDLGGVAQGVATYAAAARLAKFALANAPAGLPAPRFYRALRQALRWLDRAAAGQDGFTPAATMTVAAWSGATLAFLAEHGLLPADNLAAFATLAPAPAVAVLTAAETDDTPPVCDPAAWERLDAWLRVTLARADCR